MIRAVKIKPNKSVPKCPKCANSTDFNINSRQVSEDCCEIWATCVCGFDPTEENTGNRMEDVWGGCSDENCLYSIDATWIQLLN